MSEQKPRIGKKGGAKEIAKKLTEIRRKPISKEIFDIVTEISERNRKSDNKKIAKSEDAELFSF
ncbi:MAG: hypothetical protein V4596_05425 [Bdellovibrionota bacterium]